jgi:hypothetical protein
MFKTQSRVNDWSAVEKSTLKILAATTWYTGVAVLILKSALLLKEASQLSFETHWITGSVVLAILLGAVKAKYIFINSCRKNLIRIEQLNKPKIWQFFRPTFFLFLVLMITAGAKLSSLAHGDFIFLLSVAVVDLSIASALLFSSYLFISHS